MLEEEKEPILARVVVQEMLQSLRMSAKLLQSHPTQEAAIQGLKDTFLMLERELEDTDQAEAIMEKSFCCSSTEELSVASGPTAAATPKKKEKKAWFKKVLFKRTKATF